MVAIKSIDDIAAKYAEVTPGRSAYYKDGVLTTSKDWETNTKAAEGNWAAGVSAAAAKKTFSKGVSEAGTGKWREKASTIGADRWGSGVTAGVEDYKKGFSKYHAVISGLKLTPRKEAGNPANYTRVTEVGSALHKAKVGS
jgi:hypothetical protein